MSIPGPRSISLNMNGVADPRDRGNSDEIGTIFIEMPFEKDLNRTGWDVYDELLEKSYDNLSEDCTKSLENLKKSFCDKKLLQSISQEQQIKKNHNKE